MWNNLSAENIFFTLIDFQERLCPIMPEALLQEAKKNVILLLRMFKELEVSRLYTEQYPKGLGRTDSDILKECGNLDPIEKTAFSCMGAPSFKEKLEASSKPIVVISGMETHICVLQTVLDLLDRKLDVIVLKDACVSSTVLKMENGLQLMKDAGAHILNTETLLFYLLKSKDHPKFKTLSKYMKG